MCRERFFCLLHICSQTHVLWGPVINCVQVCIGWVVNNFCTLPSSHTTKPIMYILKDLLHEELHDSLTSSNSMLHNCPLPPPHSTIYIFIILSFTFMASQEKHRQEAWYYTSHLTCSLSYMTFFELKGEGSDCSWAKKLPSREVGPAGSSPWSSSRTDCWVTGLIITRSLGRVREQQVFFFLFSISFFTLTIFAIKFLTYFSKIVYFTRILSTYISGQYVSMNKKNKIIFRKFLYIIANLHKILNFKKVAYSLLTYH